MIDYADKPPPSHYVTFIAKAFTYFSQDQDGPEEKSLRAEAESLIRRYNTSVRGSGKREATHEGG